MIQANFFGLQVVVTEVATYYSNVDGPALCQVILAFHTCRDEELIPDLSEEKKILACSSTIHF